MHVEVASRHPHVTSILTTQGMHCCNMLQCPLGYFHLLKTIFCFSPVGLKTKNLSLLDTCYFSSGLMQMEGDSRELFQDSLVFPRIRPPFFVFCFFGVLLVFRRKKNISVFFAKGSQFQPSVLGPSSQLPAPLGSKPYERSWECSPSASMRRTCDPQGGT